MRTRRLPRQPRENVTPPTKRHTAVLILAPQTGDAIRRRRDIREHFHDSQAVTITAKRPSKRQ